MTNLPAKPDPLLPPDLLKSMAMDIGKEVAAYIERMYPAAVEAASSSFLLSLRNSIYNEIVATMEARTVGETEMRLERRKSDRRKLRALVKAVRTLEVGEYEKADDIIHGRIPLEPDL
jgi:hypothetical protein